VGLPRTDLKVTLDGVELKPGFALGGWLAFEKMGDQSQYREELTCWGRRSFWLRA